MIARPQNRFKPIPFSNPLRHQGAHWSEPSPSSGLAPVQWHALPPMATRLEAAEPPRDGQGGEGSPWGSLAQLMGTTGSTGPGSHRERTSSNDAHVSPVPANRRTSEKAGPEPKAAPKRSAMARYDGPHSLSIRSAASGRHYRFEHTGATQTIDAIDIALMRRIEDISLL